MDLLHFLAAEASAVLGFVVFSHLTKYRPRNNEEVVYNQQLPHIRAGFKLTLLLVFHQLIFSLWNFHVLGFPVTGSWTHNISQAGAICCLIGLALYLWSRIAMKDHLLPPMSVAPQNKSMFVTTGPYSFSRNPMYLSYWLTFTGVQLLTLSPLVYFSPLLIQTFHRWVLQEEKNQLDHYGEPYAHYLMTTPRWLSIIDLTHTVRKSLYLD